MEQWHGRLTAALPDARIGRLGDSGKDVPADRATCSSRPATRPRRTSRCRPATAGGLLIADECHGLGGGTLRRAMLPQYDERLGLTATLERSDDAVTELLLPVLRRHLLPLRLRAGDRRRRVRAAPGRVRRRRALGRRTGRVHRDRAATRERASITSVWSATCRSSRSATSSPRSRISPSATPAPTAAPRASTSTRSPSGARSWRSRSASTSCSAVSRRRSRTPTARWCSPRPCAPRTTPSTGSIRWCRST